MSEYYIIFENIQKKTTVTSRHNKKIVVVVVVVGLMDGWIDWLTNRLPD